MNRRASGEELALFMFLTIMIILLLGIVLGVYSFFKKGYDFRLTEAAQLRSATLDCFMRVGPGAFFAVDFNFSRTCSFSESILSDGNHYVRISEQGAEERRFSKGVSDYEQQCTFTGARGTSAYPRCVSGSFEHAGVRYSYLFGSNQQGRRLRA